MPHTSLSSRNTPWVFLSLACLLLIACANPIPPTGGPKDEAPPVLIEEESTPNNLTHFNQKEITLTFDEWVQLKDQNLQIVISPPLVYRPEITLKGKSVLIRFDEREVLHPQTTYVINFGSSITDLTEGNILDQYKYVFSTGAFIDSLQIRGDVVRASTGEPGKQALILLHNNLSDTAVTKLLPSYFAKANDAGQWTIGNIRGDTFNIYALIDANLNYRLDQVGEEIAFIEQRVILPDTSGKRYHLVLFAEEAGVNILDVDRRTNGITKVILTAPSKDLAVFALKEEIQNPRWSLVKDTLVIWNAGADTLDVTINDGLRIVDTLTLRGHARSVGLSNEITSVKKFIHPAEAFVIRTRIPIDTYQPERIQCFRSDTVLLSDVVIETDSLDSRHLRIQHRWQEKESYTVVLMPAAITDIFGAVNDSLKLPFQINQANTFGQIFADISGLNDSLQYVVELVQLLEVIGTQKIINAYGAKLRFERLQPQTYQIRIIEDLNRNGRWDTGDLMQHRQPERVFIQSLEPLRAGWDLEATVIWPQK